MRILYSSDSNLPDEYDVMVDSCLLYLVVTDPNALTIVVIFDELNLKYNKIHNQFDKKKQKKKH